jgi:pimeloyl-ACP methyl ester carboxylesterase
MEYSTLKLFPTVVESSLTVGGLEVSYYDTAQHDDGGPPVVLLHGTSGTAATNFWALYPMFALKHRVISFDFAVPADDAPLTLDTYVAQAQAVIEQLSPGRPVALVGHSLGAVVAAALAGRRSDLIDSLTLVAGWMKSDRHQLLRNDIWQQLHRQGSEALAEFGIFTAYSAPFLLARPVADYEALIAGARVRTTHVSVMDLNRIVDIADDVDQIVAPTLVVGCSLDQMVPLKHSRQLFGAIANSRYVEIYSGHAVTQERPAELFVLIEDFLAGPEATAAGSVLHSQRI